MKISLNSAFPSKSSVYLYAVASKVACLHSMGPDRSDLMSGVAEMAMSVAARLVVDVAVLFFFEFLEVADDSAAAEGLAVAVVAVAEVLHPNRLEGVEVALSDGQHLLVEDPVDHIGAGRVGQAAFVVVEAVLGGGELHGLGGS